MFPKNDSTEPSGIWELRANVEECWFTRYVGPITCSSHTAKDSRGLSHDLCRIAPIDCVWAFERKSFAVRFLFVMALDAKQLLQIGGARGTIVCFRLSRFGGFTAAAKHSDHGDDDSSKADTRKLGHPTCSHGARELSGGLGHTVDETPLVAFGAVTNPAVLSPQVPWLSETTAVALDRAPMFFATVLTT